MQINFINTFILSGCWAMSATSLTFSICNSVCLRYVDDKKLSFFQSNVKYLKLKHIEKNFKLVK